MPANIINPLSKRFDLKGTSGDITSVGDSRYLQISNNLSDLTSVSDARTNLGLGTMALAAAADYYTSATVDSTFLKLDGSNDPITGAIQITAAGTALTVDNNTLLSGTLNVTGNALMGNVNLSAGSHLRIGSAVVTAAASLFVSEAVSSTTSFSGTTVNPIYTLSGNSSSINIALNGTYDYDQNGFNNTSTLAVIGSQCRVNITGSSGTVTAAVGGNYQVVNEGAGTLTLATALAVQNNANTGGGTLTSSMGLAINNQTGGGTNNSNLVIGQVTAPTGTFSIYNSSTRDNYFAGDVGIGTSDPSATLHVDASNGGATFTLSTNAAAGLTVESKTTANTNNLLRIKALGTIGGSSATGRIRFIDNDGTTDIVTGDLTASHNNPAGSRYFGFVAQHDRDGEKYPLRFFTENAAGTSTTSFFIGADADQGKVIVGNSTTTLGVLSVYGQTSVDTAVFQGAASDFPVVTLKRNDGTVTAGESLGKLQWVTNDATVTTAASQVGAYIEVTANAPFSTDAAQSIFRIYTMDATAGGSPLERLAISPTSFVINEGGIDHDFRVEGDTNTSLIHADASTDRVGINIAAPTGKLDIDQSSTTGAIPVLQLDQADVSEEFISFLATIGTGNSIEAVGAKTLTTTHFIKVKIQGGLIRYIPVGTIA